MANKRRQSNLDEMGDLEIDMSPMIDLVFLLLIFFMTSSTMISYMKDPRVQVPVAEDSTVPDIVRSRVVLNIYEDGAVGDEHRTQTYQMDEVTRLVEQARLRDPAARLHLRADKRVPHAVVKQVIAASAAGGVNNILLSTYQTEK